MRPESRCIILVQLKNFLPKTIYTASCIFNISKIQKGLFFERDKGEHHYYDACGLAYYALDNPNSVSRPTQSPSHHQSSRPSKFDEICTGQQAFAPSSRPGLGLSSLGLRVGLGQPNQSETGTAAARRRPPHPRRGRAGMPTARARSRLGSRPGGRRACPPFRRLEAAAAG